MDTSTHSSERNTYIPIPAVEPQSTIVETRELQLAGLVRESLDRVPQRSPDQCCIYRFPARHGTNEKLYTPQRLSIGPLHHGKNELQGMEEQKFRYLQAFLDRDNHNLGLEECVKAIIEWEERARCCYEEKIDFSSDELVQIFLVDGCFILESILRFYDWFFIVGPKDDQPHHINHPEIKFHLRSEMILLENQLPFFVIDGLFSLAFPNNILEFSLLQMSIAYFIDLMVITDLKAAKLMHNPPPASSEAKHFVDLLRICHLPSTPRQLLTEYEAIVLVPNAVELQNAGMNFKGCSTKPSLEVEYTTGMLELGQIKLNEHSECVLGNIIALEQCRHPLDTYISDYIMFMDKLVDSTKDVDILVQSDVIYNKLSDSTAAAALFNGLGILADVYDSNYYYGNISKQVNIYRNKRWNRWKAALKRDYLSNPWKIASTTAAVILLLLTFIQTICSLISL